MKISLGYKGGISAPQKVAALAGYDILRDGGTAIEAIVAAAPTIAFTYPHMNGIGGERFCVRNSGVKAVIEGSDGE